MGNYEGFARIGKYSRHVTMISINKTKFWLYIPIKSSEITSYLTAPFTAHADIVKNFL